MARIYLIGFMGCGKSEVGRCLAEKLQLSFCDIDERVEQRSGFTIAEIFEKFGESEFRKLESSALFSLRNSGDMVISTGGGTPCHHDNMNIIKSSGISFYIEVSPEVLAKRLKSSRIERPLIKGLSDQELLDAIESRLSRRDSIYQQCHYTINGERPITEVADEIAGVLNKALSEEIG